jgi:GMP synthase-like glutamine amidotransferase
MRVLLVNNGTKEPEKLLTLLSGHDVQVVTSDDLRTVTASEYDLVVLSGSSKFPITGNEWLLLPEIDLIKTATTPIIGICYGCELIAHAFGGVLVDHGEESKERDLVRIEVVADDPMFSGRKEFDAYDAHRWVIASLPVELRVLARSTHGPEVIRHTERLIWGFQFHPEKMVDESYGDEIFNTLLASLRP